MNGDGSEELIFISGDCFALAAIFTVKDGKIAVDNTDYHFEEFDHTRQLEYWKTTVGLDIKPLYPESTRFSPHEPDDGKGGSYEPDGK